MNIVEEFKNWSDDLKKYYTFHSVRYNRFNKIKNNPEQNLKVYGSGTMKFIYKH